MARFSTPRAAVRAAVRDVVYPITGVSGIDSDAAAYIAAIEGDGVTVSGAQRSAIDAFYRAGKTEGWYTNFHRFYLPIWGAASPNARCLVSGTSGVFIGNVTHGVGYVLRADVTGYFDTGVRADQVPGMDSSSAWLGALVKSDNGHDQYLGVQAGVDAFLLRHLIGGIITSEIMSATTTRYTTSSPEGNAGIISARRLSGVRANMRRGASGRDVLGSSTDADAGSPPAYNIYALQKNNTGSPSAGGGSEISAYWFGVGVSDDLDAKATAALKTLWETCTGLTLP